MSVWLDQIIPSIVWVRIYLVSSVIAGMSLFYLLEQLVIYGAGHFSHITVAIYRLALAIVIIGLFVRSLEVGLAGDNPNPVDVIVTSGLAILALVTSITHRRHRHFQR